MVQVLNLASLVAPPDGRPLLAPLARYAPGLHTLQVDRCDVGELPQGPYLQSEPADCLHVSLCCGPWISLVRVDAAAGHLHALLLLCRLRLSRLLVRACHHGGMVPVRCAKVPTSVHSRYLLPAHV